MIEEWNGFKGTKWQQTIDVEDFIINNYKEYTGSSEFLKGISRKTSRVWSRCQKLLDKEDMTKVLDVETSYFSSINGFEQGYIDKKNEVIVGLQTDEPLKQFINPFVALDSSLEASKNYGYRFDRNMEEHFREFAISHEEATEASYTKEIKKYREVHLLEGLPDNYGRGFIVSDFRRLPLYGADYLIARKEHDLDRLRRDINYSIVRTREEVIKQIDALKKIKDMAKHYDIDISRPAKNTKEAIQWLYFAYLGASKDTCSASLPVGNNTPFLDIYINRDLENGSIKEEEVQELIDQFIIKLRLIRFLHTPEYKNYFPGKNPLITEVIGGLYNGKSLITQTAYRFLNSLENLGTYPVPSFAILWSSKLPINFKRYCAKTMLSHHTIELLNADKLDSFNYAVTGLAGLSKIGKQIDYYGGSCNLPKALLYAINEGKDEITGELVIPDIEPIKDDVLNYPIVVKNFVKVLSKLICIYADALNIVHYMHDKYAYEGSLMAFNDTVVERYITFGIAGLSTLVDSLCAIRYAKVHVNRDDKGLTTDFNIDGSFPKFGNNQDEADRIASDIIKLFNKELRNHHMYRNAKIKVGVETVGLNMVYGNNTGLTPNGRFKGVPYAIGACPVGNADTKGLLSSLKSVMKLPKELCTNGIITTVNISGNALGSKKSERAENIIGLLDSYFNQNGSQLEINIIDKSTITSAIKDDRNYTNLVLHNGGFAVRFKDIDNNLSNDLAERTFHEVL